MPRSDRTHNPLIVHMGNAMEGAPWRKRRHSWADIWIGLGAGLFLAVAMVLYCIWIVR